MIDYHTHTDASGDGCTPVRAMIEGAIAKGVEEICITSHYDADYPLAPHLNFDIDAKQYAADVLAAKEAYAGRIRVKLGLEVGMLAGQPQTFDKIRRKLEGIPFDFLIGSCHYIEGPDFHRPPAWRSGVTRQEVCERYIRALMDCIQAYDGFDVLGHITYYSRYNPSPDREMHYTDAPDAFDALFKMLIARGKGIEINTSVQDKMGFFCPDYDIVKRYRELGGEVITIGSDAHVPERICANYEAACAMLKRAGFEAICTFDQHRPSFVRI